MKVSIIIPVIRTEKAKRCINAINQNAGIPRDDYEVIFREDIKRIGCPKMVKQLVTQTKYDLVCFLGDDTIPQPDFLKNALRAMAAIPDGWGMVSFNDNPTITRSGTHWICHKKLLPLLGGEFFHTGYKHCFCDDELMVRCQLMNRYIYAYDAVLEHDHFIFKDGKPDDDDLKKIYSEELYQADQGLFQARSANNWQTPKVKKIEKPISAKVLIGVPSGDMWFAGFSMSLVQMIMRSFIEGVQARLLPDKKSFNIAYATQIGVVNQNSSIIEVGRNTMVQNAINLGVDYLLTLDSDMTFPPDTLIRLLKHGKDLVCCDAVKRREPFGTVCKGLDGKPINHDRVRKKLIELKGGTSAVQLVSVKALKKIEPPHYAVTWDDNDGTKFVGEDYYFNEKARCAGAKTYCDTELSKEIGHIGLKEYKI